MSTKLRVAVEIEGLRRAGSAARKFLRDMLPVTVHVPERVWLLPPTKRIEWFFEKIESKNKKLYLFREPARIKEKDSKYRQLMKAWGFFDVAALRIEEPEPAPRRIQLRAVRRVPLPTQPPQPQANRRVVLPVNPAPAPRIQWTWATDPLQGIDFFGEQI